MGARRRLASLVLLGAALLPVLPLFLQRQLPIDRDQADFFLPIARFTSVALDRGETPLWNPRNFLGEPWAAGVQAGVHYPPVRWSAAMPFGDARRWLLVFHRLLFIGGLYRLTRRCGLSRGVALVSALVAGFGAPFLSLATYDNNHRTLAWFPGVLLMAMRIARRRPLALSATGVGLALAFLAGEPQLAALLAIAVVAIVVGRDDSSWSDRIRRLAVVAMLAVTLSAPTLIPFLEFWQQSDRASGLPSTEAARQSLSIAGAVEIVAGLGPANYPRGSNGPDYLAVPSIGLTTTFFALLGIPVLWRRSRIAAWLGGGLVAFAGVAPWLGSLPFRYPIRALLPVLMIGVPILVALALAERVGPFRTRWWMTAALACLLAAAAAVPLGVVEPARAGRSAAILAVVVGLLRFAPLPTTGLRPLLGGALLIGEAIALGSSVPTNAVHEAVALAEPPLAEIAAERQPGVRLMADPPVGRSLLVPRRESDLRFFERGRLLAFGYSNLLGTSRSLQGGGPLLVERSERFIRHTLSSPRRAELLAAARVGAFLSMGAPPVPGVTAVAARSGISLSEWRQARPRAWVVESWRHADSPAAAEAWLDRLALDDEAVVEGPLESRVESSPTGPRWRVVRVIHDEADRLEVAVDTSHGGLLVVPDAYYPGWKAAIDGRAAAIVPTNVAMRGVRLPAGRATVTLAYRPASVRWGRRLGIVGGIGLLLLALYEWRRR